MRYSDDPDMGHLSDATIRQGIERGRQQIAILDGNLALDDALANDHGAFDRPSKAFEAWSNADHERRTRALRFAVSEAEKELARRAAHQGEP